MEYSIICIYASEEARWQGRPLADALMQLLREGQMAARCLVTRGVAGCYEDGEMASGRVEVLSFNLPLKIEIVLPAAEAAELLPRVTEMVEQGLVGVSPLNMVAHKVKQHLVPPHLKVRDVMNPEPRSVRPDQPLSQALEILLGSDFSGLPVVDGQGRPLGMLTDGDLLYRAGIPIRVRFMASFADQEVGPFLQGLSGKTVGQIMTAPAVTVAGEQPLGQAVQTMLSHGLRRLPVVDEAGLLKGMLSRVDIFRAIGQHAPLLRRLRNNGVSLAQARRAGDAMLRNTPTASPETPLEEVIKLLGNSSVERVAVLDQQGRLLGLISEQAMLPAFAGHKPGLWHFLMSKLAPQEEGERQAELIRHYQDTKAGQVMESEFASVAEETPLEEAAALMTEKRIKRLPVLDGQGRLRGMLSREALLRLGAAPAPAGPGGGS
ncbi:MAG: DUF190 domain-containing protein [Pseudomonadota bacterium]